MKILFVLICNNNFTNIDELFSSELITFLSKNHIIGVLTNKMRFKKKFHNYVIGDQYNGTWDVVITQNYISAKKISIKAVKNKFYHVHFCNQPSFSNLPVYSRNLKRIFIFDKVFDKIENFPSEFYKYLPTPFFNKNSGDNFSHINKSKQSKIELFYKYDNEDKNLKIVASIINFVNKNINLNLTLQLPTDVINILKISCNNNIKLVDSNYSVNLFDFDLNIGSEKNALSGLINGLPTLIVGNRGFGGIVTIENLQDFLSSHLSGRLGGEIGEPTPYWILFDEISDFRQKKDFYNSNAIKISTILKKMYSKERIFSLIENDFNENASIVNSNEKLTLKPFLYNNYKLFDIENNETYYIINSKNNFIVGSVTQQEHDIITSLDGEKTILEISSNFNTKLSTLITFLNELFFENVIGFSN